MPTRARERYVRVHDFCSVLTGFYSFHFKIDMVPVDRRYESVGQHIKVVWHIYTCVVQLTSHTKLERETRMLPKYRQLSLPTSLPLHCGDTSSYKALQQAGSADFSD